MPGLHVQNMHITSKQSYFSIRGTRIRIKIPFSSSSSSSSSSESVSTPSFKLPFIMPQTVSMSSPLATSCPGNEIGRRKSWLWIVTVVVREKVIVWKIVLLWLRSAGYERTTACYWLTITLWALGVGRMGNIIIVRRYYSCNFCQFPQPCIAMVITTNTWYVYVFVARASIQPPVYLWIPTVVPMHVYWKPEVLTSIIFSTCKKLPNSAFIKLSFFSLASLVCTTVS